MDNNPDFRQLCIEVTRLYYYGRHDGLAACIDKINAALVMTVPSKVTTGFEGLSSPSEP